MREFYVILFLFIFCSASAQKDSAIFNSGLALKNSISHSGFSTGLQYKIFTKKIVTGIGVKTEIDRNSGIASGPIGITSDVEFIVSTARKIDSYFNLDYQILFVEKDCGTDECASKKDRIHEYTAGYGIRWKISPSFSITNRVNIGRYTESLYSEFQRNYIKFSGYNSMVMLGMEVKW